MAVLVGHFIMSQGAAMFAHGGHNPTKPFVYTPDSGAGGPPAPPNATIGMPVPPMHPGAQVLDDHNYFRPVGVGLMAIGLGISILGNATFTYLGWSLARVRVICFLLMSLSGFGMVMAGYYLRQAGAEAARLDVVHLSIGLRVAASLILFYCIPRSFSTAEIVLANVMRNGWKREELSRVSFTMGGALVPVWAAMPSLNPNPFLVQCAGTASSLLLILGYSLRGTDVERLKNTPRRVSFPELSSHSPANLSDTQLFVVDRPDLNPPFEMWIVDPPPAPAEAVEPRSKTLSVAADLAKHVFPRRRATQPNTDLEMGLLEVNTQAAKALPSVQEYRV